MRLSRLLIGVAVAFSASAFAVGPPGSQGPRADESMQPQAIQPQQAPSAEERDQQQGAATRTDQSQAAEREATDSWMNARSNGVWQSSAQGEASMPRESDRAQGSERTDSPSDSQSRASTPGDAQSVPSNEAPKSVRENTPSPEEQSK